MTFKKKNALGRGIKIAALTGALLIGYQMKALPAEDSKDKTQIEEFQSQGDYESQENLETKVSSPSDNSVFDGDNFDFILYKVSPDSRSMFLIKDNYNGVVLNDSDGNGSFDKKGSYKGGKETEVSEIEAKKMSGDLYGNFYDMFSSGIQLFKDAARKKINPLAATDYQFTEFNKENGMYIAKEILDHDGSGKETAKYNPEHNSFIVIRNTDENSYAFIVKDGFCLNNINIEGFSQNFMNDFENLTKDYEKKMSNDDAMSYDEQIDKLKRSIKNDEKEINKYD